MSKDKKSEKADAQFPKTLFVTYEDDGGDGFLVTDEKFEKVEDGPVAIYARVEIAEKRTVAEVKYKSSKDWERTK